jgi:DNA-binding MarR family transcriptional regulator
LKFGVGLPFLKLDEYPEELRILVLLHVLGAADSEHAISRKELSDVLGITIETAGRLLQRLVDLGYIETFRDSFRRLRYYLTQRGIIKACSLFS